MKLRIEECSMHTIVLADGTTTYRGSRVPAVPIAIGNYRDRIDFLTAPIKFDVILGKPWLDTYNPLIYWSTNQLSFESPSGSHQWQSLSAIPAIPDEGLLSAKQLA